MPRSTRVTMLTLSALLFSPIIGLSAQSPHPAAPLPQLVKRDGRYALMVDGAPYLMLGAQVNNSSAWPSSMPEVWPAVEELHINTLEAPVYWETLEPTEGHFDFAQTDMLLDQARLHHLRLVLLWFGTWKNGSGHYTPQWIKTNEAKYPHVLNAKGMPVDSLSPHAPATLAADKLAFATLMRHLRMKDPQHTVIMVQVENESGTYGSVRDHSAAADALFAQQVPRSALRAMGKTQAGTWQQVFGDEADGFFHTWYVASFIEQVAAAGKAEYPLPFYANAALRDPFHPGKQGSWESGGPTDDVLALWKAAAPSIDVLAPDIYSSDHAKYVKELDLYSRPDNALMVPETGNSTDFARYCFAAIGHGALGWSPFGMDFTGYSNYPNGAAKIDDALLKQFSYNFAVLGPIDRLIARLNFEGKVEGAAESEATHVERLNFDDWTAIVSYGLPQFGGWTPAPGNKPATGEALVAQLGPNEFLVTGYNARVDFEPSGKAAGKQRQFLAVEEGIYSGERWTQSRIWNGDQTDYGLNFVTAPQLLRVSLATY
jgi:beta-galactosidase GanA